MITLLEVFHWSQLLQPQFYIEHGGLWLILFVVFAETGLFAGFFLPGDSLLFVAGIYSTNLAAELWTSGNEFADLFLLMGLIAAAGIAGNATGYWFGKKVGPAMFSWKENLLFKQKYLIQAYYCQINPFVFLKILNLRRGEDLPLRVTCARRV